jgi:hypothetical protein
MTDLAQDYADAKAILEGRSGMQPTMAHLRAMQNHHDDVLMQICMKLGKLHEEVMDL